MVIRDRMRAIQLARVEWNASGKVEEKDEKEEQDSRCPRRRPDAISLQLFSYALDMTLKIQL